MKRGWRETGKREPHIKADVLTPKPNINQLPGNRGKDIKKKKETGCGGRRGLQSVVKIPSDAGEEKVRVRVFACERRRGLLSATEPHESDLGSSAGATHPPRPLPQHSSLFVCGSLPSPGRAGEWLPACRGRQARLI